jgi:bleomycin hydrolase
MKVKHLLLSALVLGAGTLSAQELPTTNKKGGNYQFEIIKSMDATDVQNQYRSGTCWSFSTLSFFESELIRMGKTDVNLSEMFIVRNAYLGKAERYVRMHGHTNFGAGGAFHDIPWVIKRYGIVPESAYKGLNYGSDIHFHSELDEVLLSMAGVYANRESLTTAWKNALANTIDSYFGTPPTEFKVEGKKYTPKSYADDLGLNMDDYVGITSFNDGDFYDKYIIEVPDNWVWEQSYNVPLNDFMQIMEDALVNGYTFAWGADISEKGFSYRDGLAIVPENEETIRQNGRDNKHFSDAGAQKTGDAFNEPVKELEITQELRQEAYDNFETTDDHGMHAVGLAKDQNGTKYLVVKNSWGKSNDCDGYFFASFPYVEYKTMNIYLHKDALTKAMKKKLGIK